MNDRQTAGESGRATSSTRRFSLSLDSIKGPLAALGFILIFAAIGYFLIYGGFETPMRILLAAGILLVGIAVAIDPEAVLSKLTTRNALYGGNTLALAAIFVGILALINVLGSRRHERWDFTTNKQFSLSDETVKVLDQVENQIHAMGFFAFDDTRRKDLEDQLNEYQIRSNGKFSWELIDPVEQPALAQRFAIREFGTTVLLMGDQKQQITGTRESDLTPAILKLVKPTSKRAYFTVGHNEHRLDGFDRDGYSDIKRAMEARNFTVETLSLFATEAIPDDAGVVVVGGPREPLSEGEVDVLGAYFDRGGKLLLLADPQIDSGLAPLLARWNIELGNAYVIETDRNAFRQSPFWLFITRFPVHKITENLPSVLLPETTYINVPKDTPRGAVMTALAQSTDRSWAETSDLTSSTDPNSIRFDEGSDIKGPLTLAVAFEQRPDSVPGIDPDPGTPKPRLVVFGTSRFITNEFSPLPVGNTSFFLNSANWAVGEEELISIRPKQEDVRRLALSMAQANTIFYSTTFFLPMIILGMGVAVWWSRR